MAKIMIIADITDDNVIGLKEAIANDLEKYTDIKYMDVKDITWCKDYVYNGAKYNMENENV